VDDREFWERFNNRNHPNRVKEAVHQKIEEIRRDPSATGGRYRPDSDKWSYTLLGGNAYILIVKIDDRLRTITPLDVHHLR